MYRIQLSEFEGPLDLLLFFIRRDELDIFDIPIARIADEYLGYVRVLEQVDLDSVGDFLYMAALLIGIKAKMLLPSPEVDEEGEPIDPRRELVERLLEYVRYKEASQRLVSLHEERADLFTRGKASAVRKSIEQEPVEVNLDASVFDLVAALRRVLTDVPENEEPTHAIVREEYSIEEQQEYVRRRLPEAGRTSFIGLVRGRSRPFIITTFLAILELARSGEVTIVVPARVTDFFLEPGIPAEPGGDGEAATNGHAPAPDEEH